MKKHDHKHIEIVAADGFAPAELKMLQVTLEQALGEVGTKATIDVRTVKGKQGAANPIKGGDAVVMEVTRDKRAADVFEEALRCVEAL